MNNTILSDDTKDFNIFYSEVNFYVFRNGTCKKCSKAATREAAKIVSKYDLDPESAQVKNMISGTRGEIETAMQTAMQAGHEAIRAEIERLDAVELQRAQVRATDDAYLHRLETKLQMLRTIDPEKIDDNYLQVFTAEFADDPIALASIRGTIEGVHPGFAAKWSLIEPQNTNGVLQKHLQVVEGYFKRSIQRAAAQVSLRDLQAGTIPSEGYCDTFCAYAAAQDDSFSLPDGEVFDAISAQYPNLAIDAGMAKMQLGITSEHSTVSE